MKFQEGSVFKYLPFRNFQSPLGFSVDQTYQIMELVNEWFPTGKFRNFDTPFRTDSTYDMSILPLTGNDIHKAEMEYYRNFVHNIGKIQHIFLIGRLDIFNGTYCLETQTMATALTGFQGIKRCVQYLTSHPQKPIFYPYNYYYG